MQAGHLQPGPGAVVVVQDHGAVGVRPAAQQLGAGGDARGRPEQVDRQAHGVDPQVHEGAPARGRVEGRGQGPAAVGLHPAGELLLDQQGPVHPAQLPAGQDLTQRRHPRLEGGHPALHEEAVGRPGRGDHGPGLVGAQREGLLHQHVEARLQGGHGLVGVEDVGAAHVDQVRGGGAGGPAGRQQLGDGGVGGPDPVLGGEGGGVRGAGGDHRHHLHARGERGGLHEPAGDKARANDRHPDGCGSRRRHTSRVPVVSRISSMGRRRVPTGRRAGQQGAGLAGR